MSVTPGTLVQTMQMAAKYPSSTFFSAEEFITSYSKTLWWHQTKRQEASRSYSCLTFKRKKRSLICVDSLNAHMYLLRTEFKALDWATNWDILYIVHEKTLWSGIQTEKACLWLFPWICLAQWSDTWSGLTQHIKAFGTKEVTISISRCTLNGSGSVSLLQNSTGPDRKIEIGFLEKNLSLSKLYCLTLLNHKTL